MGDRRADIMEYPGYLGNPTKAPKESTTKSQVRGAWLLAMRIFPVTYVTGPILFSPPHLVRAQGMISSRSKGIASPVRSSRPNF